MTEANPSYLYDSLINLLGKSSEDARFLELLERVGPPTIQEEIGILRRLAFYRHGFIVQFALKHNLFCGLGFHFWTRGVRDCVIEPYRGDLLNEVRSTDGRFEVRRKLGLNPVVLGEPKPDGQVCMSNCEQIELVRELYELPPQSLTFHFDSKNDKLCYLGIVLSKLFC